VRDGPSSAQVGPVAGSCGLNGNDIKAGCSAIGLITSGDQWTFVHRYLLAPLTKTLLMSAKQ
jgi:hypothetical protein